MKTVEEIIESCKYFDENMDGSCFTYYDTDDIPEKLHKEGYIHQSEALKYCELSWGKVKNNGYCGYGYIIQLKPEYKEKK